LVERMGCLSAWLTHDPIGPIHHILSRWFFVHSTIGRLDGTHLAPMLLHDLRGTQFDEQFDAEEKSRQVIELPQAEDRIRHKIERGKNVEDAADWDEFQPQRDASIQQESPCQTPLLDQLSQDVSSL